MNPKILEMVPWDAPMPATPQTILILLAAVMFLLSVWYMWSEHKRRGDWVPIYAFIGGGIAVVYEPLGDIIASVFYPYHGAVGWIDLFGRPIPMFIGLIYFWYMSVPAVFFLRQLEKGLTTAALWRQYFLALGLALAIEMFGVNMDAWIYYGPHAFVVLGVPLWDPITYTGFVVAQCVAVHAVVTNLDRRHHWVVVLAIPLGLIAGHATLALPGAAALFSTDNPVWIWLGATLSIALTFLMVHLVGLAYCCDSKRKASSRLDEQQLAAASC